MTRISYCGALLCLLLLQPVHADGALGDPTAPTYPGASGDKVAGSGWVLNSTLVAPDRRIAIINGKRLREGDSLGDARVVKINPSEVRLQSPRQEITLRLLARSVRIPARSAGVQ